MCSVFKPSPPHVQKILPRQKLTISTTKQSSLHYRTNMLPSTFLFLLAIYNCLAYNSQWVPSFYLGSYPERFQTLRMYRGSCSVSLNTFRSNHFNVEIPLINGSIPAGFCAILLNSMDNLNLAIAIEQGLTNVNNGLLNQNIRLFQIKNGNVKFMQK